MQGYIKPHTLQGNHFLSNRIIFVTFDFYSKHSKEIVGFAYIKTAGSGLNQWCINTRWVSYNSQYKQIRLQTEKPEGGKSNNPGESCCAWCGTRSRSLTHPQAWTCVQLASYRSEHDSKHAWEFKARSSSPAAPTCRNKCHFVSKALIKQKRQPISE